MIEEEPLELNIKALCPSVVILALVHTPTVVGIFCNQEKGFKGR